MFDYAMPTIRDVARLAQVSISTASLTLAGSDRVKDATAQRVREAAESLNYHPNAHARGLKSGRASMIGVVVGDISNPFFARLLKGIERQALSEGYHVVVAETDTFPDREIKVLENLTSQPIGGIILTPSGRDAAYRTQISRIRVPIIAVDQPLAVSGVDFVGSDGYLAASMLTEHLITLGHRRIAHITGPRRLWTATERLRGFRETLKRLGIETDDSLIVDGDYRDTVAFDETMKLMARDDRPTAILSANNVMALGALQAIQDLGLRCPQDVSLACFDDVPWGNVIQPRLTMVIQDIDELARIAMENLIERMKLPPGNELSARQRVLVPRLVERESTAPPAVG